MEKQRFTLSIFTENVVGLTNRISIIFSRRKLNIESLTTSASEVEHIHRFTIVFNATESAAQKLSLQIEKQIDVVRCFLYEDKEMIYQEVALYKVAVDNLTDSDAVEDIVRKSHARILAAKADFMVIEKTGHEEDTQALYEALKPFGLLQFGRSGRIALSKERQEISTLLAEFEQENAIV
ncbi:acetolactate synthase small subunit [Flammeovirga kamogawensis]|uniref:Acetolactate synthase small subunit n=1 Tax=Flammeovirga kamogawensis TaxID=373891 RepID=A0ABX8GUA3_9BACT|nr:acetolactate synthase small subunit [Flammeovirga kamogawensis]MBB6459973.1 acetolactate synthase-1/3 small subunit [Flammeovirga kamogawensis]QWG06978.1 acetolactate synthase small subunit [Flammeovirga kamogawensis]TRX68798.1 acetolactate synthase small subunit [Flammeovirga kamogawensis]